MLEGQGSIPLGSTIRSCNMSKYHNKYRVLWTATDPAHILPRCSGEQVRTTAADLPPLGLPATVAVWFVFLPSPRGVSLAPARHLLSTSRGTTCRTAAFRANFAPNPGIGPRQVVEHTLNNEFRVPCRVSDEERFIEAPAVQKMSRSMRFARCILLPGASGQRRPS